MILSLLACGDSELLFDISPSPLDLGTVDFVAEMPDEGYATGGVSLANVGETSAVLTMPDYDAEVFCIAGFTTQDFPVEMSEVKPGSTYVLTVGICGYPPGQAGEEVETSFEVWTDGTPDTLTIDVVFTPNRVTG